MLDVGHGPEPVELQFEEPVAIVEGVTSPDSRHRQDARKGHVPADSGSAGRRARSTTSRGNYGSACAVPVIATAPGLVPLPERAVHRTAACEAVAAANTTHINPARTMPTSVGVLLQ